MADIQTRATIARLVATVEKQDESITMLIGILGRISGRVDQLEEIVGGLLHGSKANHPVLSDEAKASIKASVSNWRKPGAH